MGATRLALAKSIYYLTYTEDQYLSLGLPKLLKTLALLLQVTQRQHSCDRVHNV